MERMKHAEHSTACDVLRALAQQWKENSDTRNEYIGKHKQQQKDIELE